MTILKWISIILFLLLVVSIIIAILTTFFITVSSIINVFRKYPEINKHWFKEESYETYHYGDYKSFEPYETKEGAIISVSRSDGQKLYDLKETVKFLLFALIIAILMFGAYNTSSLLGGILC